MGQFTVSASDLDDSSAFVVPSDEPGSATSIGVDDASRSAAKRWYVHVSNGFNENIDVVVQGSHYQDENIDNPVDDGATETITSGDNGAFDGETGHSYIQLSVEPAANPTSGDLTVTFQSREE